MIRKIVGLAVVMLVGLLSCSSIMAQKDDASALKERVLSKVKACGCEASLSTCGDCPVAVEIKDYVGKLIEAKVPENKMIGLIVKSFPTDVVIDVNSQEEANQQLNQLFPPDSPRLVADTISFDFGKVNKKIGSVNHEFTLTNTGKSDLIIQNIRASCTCTKVSLRTAKESSPDFGAAGSGPSWQAVIKPGETAILEVLLDLNEIPAGPKPVFREVFVKTNDPVNSLIALKVFLEVSGS